MGAGVTVTLIELLPLSAAILASAADKVCVPAVSKIALRLLELPVVSAKFAGNTACTSLLVKCTVPEYAAETLFAASSALTLKL